MLSSELLGYEDLPSYLKAIDPEHIIKRRIKQHERTFERRQNQLEDIAERWGVTREQDFFPAAMAPPSFSKNLFEFIAQASKHITRLEAVEMLEQIISERVSDLRGRGFSNSSIKLHITRADAMKLRDEVLAKCKSIIRNSQVWSLTSSS